MVSRSGVKQRRLALATLVVVVLLLPMPGSQGQVATQLLVPHEDTTYGWMFPDEHAARGTLDDDDADMSVSVLFGATPPVPLPVGRAVEITALHIDEIDPELIRLRLEVAELDAAALQREQTAIGISYVIGFELAGYEYRASGQMTTSCTAPEDTTCGNLAAAGLLYKPRLTRANNESSTPLGMAPSRILEDQNAIEVLVPRHLTLTDGPGHPGAGTFIQGAWATSSTTHVLYDRWYDDVRSIDSAPVLRLTRDAYGSQVVVSTQPPVDEKEEIYNPFEPFNQEPIEPRRERVDVSEDMPARVPLYVTNVLERKLIVVPDISTASGGNGYTVRAPDGIEIAAGATRRIELVVNGTTAIDPQDPLVLNVQVRPLGLSSDIGDRLDVIVRSVPRLSPDAPRLYLHADEPGNGLYVGDVEFGGFYNGYLSTLAVDPTGPAEEAPLASNCLCPSAFVWQATSALATPAMLDLARDGTLHLEVDAPTAGEYQLTGAVAYNGEPIGSGALQVSLSVGENVIDVPLIFAAETPRLEPGGLFELDINARFIPPVTPFSFVTLEQDAPRVRLQGLSYLELPLDEAPLAVSTADHLVVAIGAGYDAYQYVNPGRTTLWNVTVLNQGTDNDTVTIDAKANDPAWTLRIAPGRAYRLGPGESVTVGVLATAPEDAAEETHVMVNVTATSKMADGRGATMTVRAIVTSGVQIPDVVYTADNETSARVADAETEDSPGVPLVVTGIAALGLAMALRRRRA